MKIFIISNQKVSTKFKIYVLLTQEMVNLFMNKNIKLGIKHIPTVIIFFQKF